MAFENLYGNIDFQAGNKMDMAKQQQFAQMLGMGMQAAQASADRKLKERQMEIKSQQVDLKSLSENAAMKAKMGIPLTPKEQAALEVRAQTSAPVVYTDAYGNQVVRESGWAGMGGQTQGVNPNAGRAPVISSPQGAIHEEGAFYEDLSGLGGGERPMPPSDMRLSVEDLQNIPQMDISQLGGNIPFQEPRDVVSDGVSPIDETPQGYAEMPPPVDAAMSSPKTQMALAESLVGTDEYYRNKKIDNLFKGMELNKASLNKQRDFEGKLDELIDQYGRLIEAGSAKTELPENAKIGDVMRNITASAATSGIGSTAGKFLGTKTGSAIESIETQQPLVFGELRTLLGMTGQEMNTEKESDYYKAVISNPNNEIGATLRALRALSSRFGTGESASKADELLQGVESQKRTSQMTEEQKMKRLQELRAKAGR